MQAVVYLRISQDRTGEGAGVERQRRECEKLAERLGWNIIHVYSDNDVSASSGRVRPEYARMLGDMRRGGIGGLLAYHPDRLYRSLIDLAELIEVCDEHGIDIETSKAGAVDLTTASGRLAATMLAAVARHETERMGERLKSAKEQAAREGKFRGGQRPFGYKADGMTIEPAEAAALKEASELLVSGGSLTSIARTWNQNGMLTVQGNQWNASKVRNVVVRARNAGIVEKDDGTEMGAAQWEPIVDRPLLDAVRAVIRDPSRRTAVSYERVNMGTGVYRCGKCGAPMYRARSKTRIVYRCRAADHLSVGKEIADQIVSMYVVERLSDPSFRAEVLAADSNVDVASLMRERDAARGRKDELASMFAKRLIDGSQLSRGSAELDRELSRIDVELARSRDNSPLLDMLSEDEVAARWEALSVSQRVSVIGDLMTVVVLPAKSAGRGSDIMDRILIEWK